MSSVTIAAVQAASVLMNQEATVAKAVELIAKAAAGGSRLVVFPEVFIPSTPVWVYHQPIWEGDDTWYAMLVDQAVTVPGPVTDRLGCAAHHPYRQPLLCRTPALMDRLRKRIADKRVLALVKAFLKAGILGPDGALRDNTTGVPQGGILSPVLANLALSVLDEHIAEIPGGPGSTQSQRATRRRKGMGNYRLVRYADDWLLMVCGTGEHAEQMRERVAAVLAPMGLRLSAEKTKITHIDDGLDFLGWRIQRHRKRGTNRYDVYTYPSRKAIKAVTLKVKTICRRNVNQPLQTLLRRLNPALRGRLPTSDPACPPSPSRTWPTTPWTGSCDGRGANTAGSQ